MDVITYPCRDLGKRVSKSLIQYNALIKIFHCSLSSTAANDVRTSAEAKLREANSKITELQNAVDKTSKREMGTFIPLTGFAEYSGRTLLS